MSVEQIVTAAFDRAFTGCDVPHRVREFLPAEDMALVVDSWRQSYRSARAMRGQHPDDYFPAMGAMIAEIVGRGGVDIVVACDVDDPSMVLAWACIEAEPGGSVLHYCWTRVELRRHGLARALLHGRQITSVSHYPIKGGIPDGWRYRPFRAWRAKS